MLPLKELRSSCRKGYFKARERKEHISLGYLVMPESREVLKNNGAISEEQRN